jgi:hypothetical protein
MWKEAPLHALTRYHGSNICRCWTSRVASRNLYNRKVFQTMPYLKSTPRNKNILGATQEDHHKNVLGHEDNTCQFSCRHLTKNFRRGGQPHVFCHQKLFRLWEDVWNFSNHYVQKISQINNSKFSRWSQVKIWVPKFHLDVSKNGLGRAQKIWLQNEKTRLGIPHPNPWSELGYQ